MKLDFVEIDEKSRKLLPENVYEYIRNFDPEGLIRVAEIDPAFADGESLSREYDIPYEMELNCLAIEGKRGDVRRYAALVVPYGKRANMNAKVRNPLGVKDVGFADLDYVKEVSGMECGSITPIGLPADWLILIDEKILQQEYVIVGGGLKISKLLLPASLFMKMANVIVVEGLAKD